MPICRWKAVDRCLALALTACCGPALATGSPDWFGPACQVSPESPEEIPVTTQRLLLQVFTRPDEAGNTLTALLTVDGALWVTADSLQQLQLAPPQASMTYQERRWYPLAGIAKLRYRYDACTQSLWLDSSALPRAPTVYALESEQDGEPLRVDPGGYLNLDTQYLAVSGDRQLSALGELGIFNRFGYGGSTVLINNRGSQRLDTNWNYDDPDRLLRLTLGDGITRPANFGQAVRFGGVQWGRAFSLRPGMVTFPQPALRGNAALPSSVDIYVNQMLRGHQDVPAGPFELTQVPVIVGQGQVQLVARDVLGRESIVTYPIYASQALLRRGLSDFTVEAGWQRQDYAVRSANYGPFLTAGTWRQGLTDELTVELRAEETAGRQGFSSSAAALVPALGTFTAGFAASLAKSRVGQSRFIGFQRIAPGWSVSLETRRADAAYTQIGDDGHAMRMRDLVSIGINLYQAGSLSLTGLRQVRDLDGRTEILGATYSFRVLRDLFAGLSCTRSSGGGRVDRQALLSLSYNFGANIFANAQVLHDTAAGYSEQLTVQKVIGDVLGYGYQATAGFGANSRRSVEGQWAQELGTFSAGVDQFSGTRGYRANYRTGLAWLGQRAFWTRPIAGSFVVVDTGGVPGVDVYADEHLAGRTDAGGILLVPNLRSYDANHLRIDDTDVPIRYELDNAAQSVRLPIRGASHVVFPVKRGASVLLRVRLASGKFVPAGASIVFADGMEGVPAGFDGKVYIDEAERHRSLTARWDGHRCRADWKLPANPTSPVDVLCREIK